MNSRNIRKVKKYINSLFFGFGHLQNKNEIFQHLSESINDYVTSGMSEDEAFDKAINNFGDKKTLRNNLTPNLLLYKIGVLFIVVGLFITTLSLLNINDSEKTLKFNHQVGENYIYHLYGVFQYEYRYKKYMNESEIDEFNKINENYWFKECGAGNYIKCTIDGSKQDYSYYCKKCDDTYIRIKYKIIENIKKIYKELNIMDII